MIITQQQINVLRERILSRDSKLAIETLQDYYSDACDYISTLIDLSEKCSRDEINLSDIDAENIARELDRMQIIIDKIMELHALAIEYQ